MGNSLRPQGVFETIHYMNPDGTECEDVAPMEEDEDDNYEDEED